jgi:Uma2 family endonuclease
MTTTIQRPAQPAIEYPDDDGEPMSDNTLQHKWMVVIEGGLEILFGKDPDVFVAGNLLWYPVEREPTVRAAPDAMVAFGRPKGRRGSYKQWEEGNVAPQVVFEVLSPGNLPDELARKFEFYEKYGVQEYYIYDPDDGTLEGWIRAGDHLEEVAEMAGFVSPRLAIRFEPGEGPDNLMIVGPDGEPFVTQREMFDQRDSERRQKVAERQRANAERQRADAADQRADDERRQKEAELQRADAERQRADAAQERAERLAARLRELGIEPD